MKCHADNWALLVTICQVHNAVLNSQSNNQILYKDNLNSFYGISHSIVEIVRSKLTLLKSICNNFNYTT